MDNQDFMKFIANLAASNIAKDREKQAYRALASSYKMIFDSFIDVGFDTEQAMRLLELSVKLAVPKAMQDSNYER